MTENAIATPDTIEDAMELWARVEGRKLTKREKRSFAAGARWATAVGGYVEVTK